MIIHVYTVYTIIYMSFIPEPKHVNQEPEDVLKLKTNKRVEVFEQLLGARIPPGLPAAVIGAGRIYLTTSLQQP